MNVANNEFMITYCCSRLVTVSQTVVSTYYKCSANTLLHGDNVL